MNDLDQETAVIAKTLELLDKGEKMEDILPLIPAGFEEKAQEYAEIVKWIESECESIHAPAESLRKILAAIDVGEKKIAEEKKIVPTLPLVAAISPKMRTVENIPAQKKSAPALRAELAVVENKKLVTWTQFFGKDSALFSSLPVSSWKTWAPVGIIAALLIFVGVNNGNTESEKAQTFAVNDISASSAPAVPSLAASAMPMSAAKAKSAASPKSLNDQIMALSAAPDSEAAAANASDSDLTSGAFLTSTANSLNENAI